MKRDSGVLRLTRIAVAAAIYVALTYAFAFMSYGGIQFRIAEILVLLCFYKKDYCYSLIIGCVLANIGSPLGWVDMVFGTMSTVFSVVTIRYCRNLYIAGVMPVLSMAFVALELFLFVPETGTFWFNLGTTMAGEACVIVVGIIIFKQLEKNKYLMNLLGAQTKVVLDLHKDSRAEEPPDTNE